MKKKLIAAAVLMCLAAAAFLLLDTIPVYPDFHKTAASMEALRQVLGTEKIQYPTALEETLTERSYRLELDGRTAFSKARGYVIDGTETYENVQIHYVLCGSTAPSDAAQAGEQTEYRGVTIGVLHYGETADQTVLEFSLGGGTYMLKARIDSDMAAQLSEAQRAALAAREEEALMEACRQMIDDALTA